MAHSIAPPPSPPPPRARDWRKPLAVIVGILVGAGAVALTLAVWRISERHPRTDDAIVRANVVGIAPRVRGQIVKLHVEDNQAVAEGEVLFELDPADFELTLAKAKAALAALDRQIEVARAHDTDLKYQI